MLCRPYTCSFFLTVLEFSKTGIVVNRERRRMAEKRRAGRQQAVSEHKRELILDAARGVRGRGPRRREPARDRDASRIYAGGALFPFRLEGSDLCRGAARLPRLLGPHRR